MSSLCERLGNCFASRITGIRDDEREKLPHRLTPTERLAVEKRTREMQKRMRASKAQLLRHMRMPRRRVGFSS